MMVELELPTGLLEYGVTEEVEEPVHVEEMVIVIVAVIITVEEIEENELQVISVER